ncbi:MAG: Fic family protein [Eubacteriales bacterium]|nr:Fic family protein [Eubacteriales bacterium]MDD4512158.1 Fic family protein [Eubacteriales bacterium]
MMSEINIAELLRQRAELESRMKLIMYDGSVDIKTINGERYLYIRKRLAGKLTSQYVDRYSEELFALMLRQSAEARALKKSIREIEKQLALAGYHDEAVSERVLLNLDFARANVKSLIYDQAVLEGVSTTFPQTETILENGKVYGVTPSDIQKIVNLKHAWEFILDKDVISAPSDYYVLCHIAKLINEGFYEYGGRIRSVPATIGGTSYMPPMPIEPMVKEIIGSITKEDNSAIDTAVSLCLYCMKTQIFNDGNKRASVIFANHYLIGRGDGLLVIPEKDVREFKHLLIAYYEGRDEEKIRAFMKEVCWRKF